MAIASYSVILSQSSVGTVEVGVIGRRKVLALDLGRRCGWSVFVPEGGPEHHKSSGVFELYREGGMPIDDGKRFSALGRFLRALDQVCDSFDIVAFEQVNGGTKGRQTTLWNGYRAIVMQWCDATNKQILPIPIHAIKAKFCGRGNASKEEMIAAAVTRGYLPFDDNEADAIATLYTALALADDRVEMERQIAAAKRVELGEFKSELVVERKKKRRNAQKIAHECLTKAPPLGNVSNETPLTIKEALTCSSASPASAQQARPRQRKSSCRDSASSKPSSPRVSKKAAASHTA
jgi:Holliday junction resolvasome RuvABC endonuclease subunit